MAFIVYVVLDKNTMFLKKSVVVQDITYISYSNLKNIAHGGIRTREAVKAWDLKSRHFDQSANFLWVRVLENHQWTNK